MAQMPNNDLEKAYTALFHKYIDRGHELRKVMMERDRLRAAAPELLEALESLVEYSEAYVVEWDQLGSDRMAAARAAIARAKGNGSHARPEFASRGKVAPGYCECLEDVADEMEERAAQLRQEAEGK